MPYELLILQFIYYAELIANDIFSQYYGFTLVMDLRDFQSSNFSFEFVEKFFYTIENVIPVRLSDIVCIGPFPESWDNAWRFVFGVISGITKKKFKTTTLETIDSIIVKENLLTFLGGTLVFFNLTFFFLFLNFNNNFFFFFFQEGIRCERSHL